MVSGRLRIPIWLMLAALFTTFVIGSKAGPTLLRDVQPTFRIVTPSVSEIYTQDVTPEIAQTLHMNRAEGVLVSDVVYSPLRAGDVIVSINGNAVRCQRELEAVLDQVNSGETFSVEIYRGGRVQTVTVQRAFNSPPPQRVLGGTEEIRGIRVASLSTQNGVIVSDVQIGTTASAMGLTTGDVILDVEGHPVRTAEEFLDFMRQLSGRPATLNVRHSNGLVDVFIIAT